MCWMIRLTCAAAPVLLCFCGAVAAEDSLATFTLQDHLRREWRNELVFFSVPDNVYGQRDAVLMGPEGKARPHQWVPSEVAASGKKSVAFFASIPELGTSTYRLVRGKPSQTTDLKVQQKKDTVSLENAKVGITLGGPRMVESGPIASVRLPGRQAVLGGQLVVPELADNVKLSVIASGPVFAEALVRYEFPDDQFWQLRFRLPAGEPVILVDDEFSLSDMARYVLRLGV